jgi:hypothetical protein
MKATKYTEESWVRSAVERLWFVCSRVPGFGIGVREVRVIR